MGRNETADQGQRVLTQSRFEGFSRHPLRGWTAARVVLALGLGLLAVGAVGLTIGSANQARAKALEAHGRTVTVQDVRVHAGYVTTRQHGGWYAIDHVQVRLPGVEHGAWVELTGLPSLRMDNRVKGELWVEGWQEPTEATTYQPPLQVTYRVGRNVDAMTTGDVATWADSRQPVIFAILAAAGLIVVAATHGPLRDRVLRRWRSRRTT